MALLHWAHLLGRSPAFLLQPAPVFPAEIHDNRLQGRLGHELLLGFHGSC